VFDSTGKVYNGATFEALNAANWATYDIAMVEGSTTGVYVGTFPALSAGAYHASYRLRAGGAPATTDTVVGSGAIEWTGTAVAVPAGSGAYTTLASVKAVLGATLATDDALLTAFIARAQAWVESYCGQIFEAAADSTRKFDSRADVEGDVLYLDYPLAAITSITNGDGVAVASTEYVTEPRNHIPYHRIRLLRSKAKYWTYLTDPEGAISITGKWAYGLAAPADIVQATERLAAYMYRQKDSQVFDVTADAETGQLIIPKGIPADVKQILQPYRRMA
jgi:hypothetical protein